MPVLFQTLSFDLEKNNSLESLHLRHQKTASQSTECHVCLKIWDNLP